MSDEFYVGYLPKSPSALGRRTAAVAAGLLAGAAAIAAALLAGQKPFPNATFEFAEYKQFEGILRERPYARLDLRSGGHALIVLPGKHGASEAMAGLDGIPVALEGSRIYRGSDQMIELRPGTLHPSGSLHNAAGPDMPARFATLTGEIVDSKCYLGVMNPGNGKVHRDCAARCISGGVPPAFVVRDADGRTCLLLLAGPDGRPLRREILDFVAEPVRIDGLLVRSTSTLQFRIDPSRIRRATE